MLDHAQLREREGNKDADDIELDEACRLCLEADDERDRRDGQDDDAVRIRQAVAAAHHLVRQERVTRQDRGQGRESVKRRVTGENQDEAGDDGDHNEQDRPLSENGRRDLRDRRVDRRFLRDGRALIGQLARRVVDDFHAGRTGQHEDGDHHRSRDEAEHRQRGGRVARLGAAEHRHAVRDRLDAGEGRATRREGAHEEESARESGEAVRVSGGSNEVVGGRRSRAQMPGCHLRETDDDHEADRAHVQVGGHGKRATGLACTAQVQSRQNNDERHRDGNLVAEESGDCRRDVVGARRNRDRNGEDVVDQQGRGDE